MRTGYPYPRSSAFVRLRIDYSLPGVLQAGGNAADTQQNSILQRQMLRPFGIGAQPPQELDLHIAHWVDVGVAARDRLLQHWAAIKEIIDLGHLRDQSTRARIFILDCAEDFARHCWI